MEAVEQTTEPSPEDLGDDIDLIAFEAMRVVFLQSVKEFERPVLESTNALALMLGGLVAALEYDGEKVSLDEMRHRFMQVGYDDYFKKKRDGEIP